MSFLSKLGQIINIGEQLFLGFAPTLQQDFPKAGGVIQTISADLSAVGDLVTTGEAIAQLKGMSGADTAKALGPLVAQVILKSTLVAGKKIADQAKFNAACIAIGGDVADVLNSLHEDSTSTVTAPLAK